MKTCIIPDIHHKVRTPEIILYNETPDRVIFLGDWFDEFYDDEKMAAKTAKWLKNRMEKHPEDIFCWGNHDLAYAYPGRVTSCSGFEEGKCRAIRSIMTAKEWARFVWYFWEDDWLYTHAGLTKPHVSGVKDIKAWLADSAEEASATIIAGQRHWMYAAGYCRGGPHPFGGIVWCDVSEFIPIKGINQLFGHTPGKKPFRHKSKISENHCIDTSNHHYYGVMENGKLTIKNCSELVAPGP